MKRFFSIAAFALALAAGEAHAAGVVVRFGPPPPRREIVVARPGPRYVWIPGSYAWRGRNYVWVNGYWTLPPRPHAVWVPGRWVARHGGHVWVAGYWR